jgi:hypothetical protein
MKFSKSLVGAVLATAAIVAHAAIVPVVDGNWNQFYFGESGTSWLDDYIYNSPGNLSFSFTLTGPAVLKVTDAGFTGDIFQVFDNGNALGLTSAPNIANTGDMDVDFDSAYASNDWSHGEWMLSAGNHLITGLSTVSAFGAGVGAIRVNAVPEPSSSALVLCALGMIGLIARRRA